MELNIYKQAYVMYSNTWSLGRKHIFKRLCIKLS